MDSDAENQLHSDSDLADDLPDNETIDDDLKSNDSNLDAADGENPEEEDVPFKGKEEFELDDEPPKLVVVQGPPKSGKTTLIKS